jgi:hypothetical protein
MWRDLCFHSLAWTIFVEQPVGCAEPSGRVINPGLSVEMYAFQMHELLVDRRILVPEKRRLPADFWLRVHLCSQRHQRSNSSPGIVSAQARASRIAGAERV